MMNGAYAMTTDANIENSWSAIGNASSAMQSAAANEEWFQVMEMAALRHQQVVDHFERFPVGPDNAEFYRSHINAMLKEEQGLQTLVLDARKKVMGAATVSNQNHRAVGAYLNTASGK